MRPSSHQPRDDTVPGPGESWTPIRLTRWSGDYLAGKGVANGRLDAEYLLGHVLGVSRLDLYLQFDRPLQPRELQAFKELLLRRARREPLQYVLGTAAFRELELAMDSRALIPRPETEVLVEEVLRWAGQQGPGLEVLDVGTGSGAIALSLLKEGEFRRVVATDASREALDLAEENARRNDLRNGIVFRHGHLFESVESDERFDVVVSNPPYIPERDAESLQPEVGEWEPTESLFAGEEGLDVLVPLVHEAPKVLRVGGLLALEVGDGQASCVSRALEASGTFDRVCIRADLAGRERIVLGVASGRRLKDL